MATKSLRSIKIDLLRGGMLSTLGLCSNLLHILETKYLQRETLIQAIVCRDNLGNLLDELLKIDEDTLKSVANDDSGWGDYLKQRRETFLGISSTFKTEIEKSVLRDSLNHDYEISNILQQFELMISDLHNLPL